MLVFTMLQIISCNLTSCFLPWTIAWPEYAFTSTKNRPSLTSTQCIEETAGKEFGRTTPDTTTARWQTVPRDLTFGHRLAGLAFLFLWPRAETSEWLTQMVNTSNESFELYGHDIHTSLSPLLRLLGVSCYHSSPTDSQVWLTGLLGQERQTLLCWRVTVP